MRKLLAAIAVSILFLGLGSHLVAADLSVWFGPTKEGDPNGLDAQTVRLVNSAQQRLDAAVHELRLQSITDAFIAAHKRGVKVRLIGDDRYYDNEYMKQLRAAGIETKSDANPALIMHDKFVVADGLRVMTGSYNLTNTCSYRNHNNLVVIEDAAVSQIFDAEFEKLWAGRMYDPAEDDAVHRVDLKLSDRVVPLEIFFQPRCKTSESKVLELLGSATKSIQVMQFAFFNSNVAKLLVDKVKAGRDVRALLDYSQIFQSAQAFSQVSRLIQESVPFAIGDDPKGKVHHKVFVVDADDPANAMVLTGSANSSKAGYAGNCENVIVIHDQKIAQRYRDEALRLLHRRDVGSATVKPRGLDGIGQVHDITVTIDSGGQPMQDVELSLPYHWKIESTDTLAVYRGENWQADSSAPIQGVTLEKRFTSQYERTPIYQIGIKGAALAATGQNSKLTVRFKALLMDPETAPGRYFIYVRGTDDSGRLMMLPSLPLISLFRTPMESVGATAGRLESDDVRASNDLGYLARELSEGLTQAVEKGNFEKVKAAVVEFAAVLEKPHKYPTRLQILKEMALQLSQALLHVESDEARELALRIGKVYGVDAGQ